MYENSIFLLTIFAILIGRSQIFATFDSFHSIIEKCNNTFSVNKDIFYIEDANQLLSETLKNDRNGKCFVHCFLQKLDLVDPKGIVRRDDLVKNLKEILRQIPGVEQPEQKMTAAIQQVLLEIVETCENSDMVKNEVDPCEKLYKFLLCFRDNK